MCKNSRILKMRPGQGRMLSNICRCTRSLLKKKRCTPRSYRCLLLLLLFFLYYSSSSFVCTVYSTYIIQLLRRINFSLLLLFMPVEELMKWLKGICRKILTQFFKPCLFCCIFTSQFSDKSLMPISKLKQYQYTHRERGIFNIIYRI